MYQRGQSPVMEDDICAHTHVQSISHKSEQKRGQSINQRLLREHGRSG